MGRLNTQSDLFLGLQELNRQNKFHKDDGYIRLLKSIINSYGIVRTNDDTLFANFEVVSGSTTGTVKIASKSYAVDDEMRIITQEAIDNIAITDDSLWYWIKIAYTEDNIEEGTVNISTDGSITGVGTTFTDVLRDQSNYPVKINFSNSAANTGDYQVVSILSDTQAILSSTTGFTSENDLTYRTVGSFTPGITPSVGQKYPYFYDKCTISIVAEVTIDTPPAKTDGEEFYLARVLRTGAVVTIQDKRTEYFNTSPNQDWIQPTLGATFTNVTGREVEYRINGIGEIEIRGAFTTTDGTADLFTLPATPATPDFPNGFRPPYTVQGFYSYSGAVSAARLIKINSSGVVAPTTTFPFSTSLTNEFISVKFNSQ